MWGRLMDWLSSGSSFLHLSQRKFYCNFRCFLGVPTLIRVQLWIKKTNQIGAAAAAVNKQALQDVRMILTPYLEQSWICLFVSIHGSLLRVTSWHDRGNIGKMLCCHITWHYPHWDTEGISVTMWQRVSSSWYKKRASGYVKSTDKKYHQLFFSNQNIQ